YDIDHDKVGKQLYTATVIPNRGAWLEYETDSNDIFSIRVDRTRKIPVTCFIRAMGCATDADIIELFGEEPKIIQTIEKDISKTKDEGLLEVYKRLRPGEPPTVDSADSLIRSMFFDPKRYDLAKVGRYKFNKKLALRSRVRGLTLAQDSICPMTNETLAEAGTVISLELADLIQDSGVGYVWVKVMRGDEEAQTKVFTNNTVSIEPFLALREIEPDEIKIKERVHLPVLMELFEQYEDNDELINALKANRGKLVPKHITVDDMMASINYIIGLDYDIGHKDDIDHLGNRRVRAVGELLQNQFRIGLSRMERVIRERMTIQDPEGITPQALINIRPVTAAIKEFFGSSQLSQFMEQTNPLGELTHKRRLSALGPGGLSRDRASFEVRDVHDSHYGRMCPIETPEGPNIGLINSLSTFARINEYGFVEAPYRKVDKTAVPPRVTGESVYVTADEEENFVVAQANVPLNENDEFITARVPGRRRGDINEFPVSEVDLMDVSPKQIVSVATALIPFLENDDVSRALMGSNMQRQAVPLLKTDSPIVGTGMEHKTARDSGVCIIARRSGVVEAVSATGITIATPAGKDHYKVVKFIRSNQGTCVNQKPLVNIGDEVKEGDIIADGPSTQLGELALGQNPLIGFMSWEGYNYEDAILLSEKLVEDDVYTSIHIEEYESEARDTKLGPEEITRDIPNVGDDALKDLNADGIIRIGAEVWPNDILVGKVTPKGETELTAEERLLRAIFGEKAREVRDTSLRVPHGESGIIVDVKVFSRKNGDELPPGVNQVVRVYIAQKRKISVGDKMAGRHGNKGVISRVLPVEDMPFLPNGRPLDIVLNPLGVPSRMNIGQVMEVHLGLAAKVLNWKVACPVFDGASESDIRNTLGLANDYANMQWDEFAAKWENELDPIVFAQLERDKENADEWRGVAFEEHGKIELRDGRSGEKFDNPVTVGYMHYLKLHHLVDDKIHARSTGPYSLVTQQPLGGKAQFGGQRFGEMEVWALEAYGAAYTLQEILTVKSDDIVGRVKTYEAIVKGENIPEPGVPESFKVLLKELQALALDVRALQGQQEVDIKESLDDVDDLNVNIEGREKDDGFVKKSAHSFEAHRELLDSKKTAPDPVASLLGAIMEGTDDEDFEDELDDEDDLDDAMDDDDAMNENDLEDTLDADDMEEAAGLMNVEDDEDDEE
ncbi:MAG: DNA-directed RNA polymerase subunit beta, partial [Defluviitaleaceae bacterium]|nr:DNA-directed RNA polymerase subunit beta [Defluviitaleaceae bacterium]